MVKHALRWTAVAGAAVAAVTVLRRIRATRPGIGRPAGVPVIGGDTWPPVPENPARAS